MTSSVLLITFILYAVSAIEFKQTTKHVPDELENVFRKFGKDPKNTDVEDTIRATVAELMPLLDDNKIYSKKERKGNFARNNREIIQSLHESNNTVKSNSNLANRRYNKLRKEIEKLLKREPISNDTKSVVTNALDQILAELLKYDGEKMEDVRRNQVFGDQPSIFIPGTIDETESVIKQIKEKWDKVMHQYIITDDTKNHNDSVRKAAFVFLTRLQQFVFDIHDDYRKLKSEYAIMCNGRAVTADTLADGTTGASEKPQESSEPIPTGRPTTAKGYIEWSTAGSFDQTNLLTGALRDGNMEPEVDDTCKNSTICSEELLEFLTNFYHQLNETIADVFNNYIEMFLNEVDNHNYDKESFANILKYIKDHVDKQVKKKFAKETANIGSVPNFATSRITALKRFIGRNIDAAKELIKTSMAEKLKNLPPTLRLTVKRDIHTTANIELGNLQNDYKYNICSAFESCNGEATWRKNNNKDTEPIDENSIHIDFKLGFGEDSLKGIVDQLQKLTGIKLRRDSTGHGNLNGSNRGSIISGRNLNGDFKGLENYVKEMNDPSNVNARKINLYRSIKPPFDNSKYQHVNITKSTIKNYFLKGTTRFMNKNNR